MNHRHNNFTKKRKKYIFCSNMNKAQSGSTKHNKHNIIWRVEGGGKENNNIF